MAPLPVGQGSKEPARGGVLGVSSATSFFLNSPYYLPFGVWYKIPDFRRPLAIERSFTLGFTAFEQSEMN